VSFRTLYFFSAIILTIFQVLRTTDILLPTTPASSPLIRRIVGYTFGFLSTCQPCWSDGSCGGADKWKGHTNKTQNRDTHKTTLFIVCAVHDTLAGIQKMTTGNRLCDDVHTHSHTHIHKHRFVLSVAIGWWWWWWWELMEQ
jgi:hypothetical protein